MTSNIRLHDDSSHVKEDYFTPPSSPFLRDIHNACLPFITKYDHLVSWWQSFLGISHYPPKRASGQKESSKEQIQTHTHPIFSPYRAAMYIHLPLCLASEFGNENFYALWAVLCQFAFSPEVACQLCIVWGLTLFIGQYIKDLLRLPRPGLQRYNPSSPLYYKNQSCMASNTGVDHTNGDSTSHHQETCLQLHRLENQYSAEFGLPSTHSAAISIPLYTLLILYRHYLSIPLDNDLQYNTSLAMVSNIMMTIITLFCLFWIIGTPLSRLYMGVHSVFDIVGGIFIGILCCGTVYLLQFTFGILPLVYTTFTGLSICIAITILMLYAYPKHEKTWTNSSGDTAVVLGSALGSIVAQTISLATNHPQSWTYYEGSVPLSSFPFTHVVTSTEPVTYNYVLPPFAYSVDMSHISTYFDALCDLDIWLSIIFAVLLNILRLVITVIVIYAIRLALRPFLYKICRVALGYPPQCPSKEKTKEQQIEQHGSIETRSQKQQQQSQSQSQSQCDLESITQRHQHNVSSTSTTLTPQAGAGEDELPPQDSAPLSSLTIDLSLIDHHDGIRPPTNSTLYKHTTDMSIRHLIILEMFDKFCGYGSMGLFAVLVLPMLTDSLGLTYLLYFPQVF